MFRKHASRPHKFAPRFEILEDRCVPATRIWDGGAVSNNWSNANNWANNIAPVAGDDLVFPSNVADKVADNNFPDGTLFRSISVHGGYTLRGNKVLLGEGGITSTGSSNVVNHKLNLGAGLDRAFNINAGSTLFIDDQIEGGNGLVKTGAGDLSLRANNSYTGLTDIAVGRLFIERDEALGAFNSSSNGTIIRNAATLLINDNTLGTIRVDEPITISSGGIIHALNDAHLRGNLVTNGTATLRHDGSVIERLLITGEISGPGGITIASGTGQVWMRGDVDNIYQGLTSVSGKLRLENIGGAAITGDLQITTNGAVRYENSGQIGNSSIVTILSGGRLFTNEYSDNFFRLNLQGGIIDGYKFTLVDWLEFANPELRLITPDRASIISVEELVATSTSTTRPAEILDLNINIDSTSAVRVNNGPAFNDLIVRAALSTENGPTTFVGPGTTLIEDFGSTEQLADGSYVVEEGLLRMNKLERTFLNPYPEYVTVTVGDGARFAGDGRIGSLYVESGGRIRPGPLSSTGKLQLMDGLVMEPGAILEVLINGTLAGRNHDQIEFNAFGFSDAEIEGATLETTVGPNADVGQNYRIFDIGTGSAIIGAFAVPPESSPFMLAQPTGQRLNINYTGGLDGNDLVLSLLNTPPMAPGLTLSSTEIDEGGTVRASGKLVDPDVKDKLRLFVNWGDGSRQELHRPGRDLFSLSHRYRHDGVYTARFEWLDQNNQGNSREFTITVNNVAPELTLRTFRTTSSGILLASGWLSDAGSDRYTATLDFGDGSIPRSKTLNRRDYFAVAHRYQSAGTYTVTITLRDAQGAETVHQRQVTIQ